MVVGGAVAVAAVAVPAAYAATTPATPTGFVKICKAGASTAVIGSFQFTVSGVTGPVTVPVGGCSKSIEVASRRVTVSEVGRAGFVLASVATTPDGRLISSNLATGKATVKVPAGNETSQTVVTFTNKVAPPPTGTLRVCKVAGPGVAIGQEFGFTVGTTMTTAKAGSCSAPLTLPVGNVTVKEKAVAGFALTAIAVTGAGSLVSSDVATGTAVVKVAVGASDVSFTNNKPGVTGCVRGKGYYKNHPDVVKKLLAGNGGTLVIGGMALTPAQVDALYDRDSVNFLNQVSQQLITARLNQLSGASTPAAVQTAIDAAQALEKAAGGPLTGKATPTTKVVLGGVTYTAGQLAETLVGYNQGSSGGPTTCA
ncbi:MAG: hypothetical protein AUI14_04270 [Actinobacteria bacterium 13_2_20CM_2_71_6]|nr:MAG: hypothetical protein AUI14_04270 [Actinobacteria bacterium 13_2_20CM_2_71_6]